MTSRRISRKVSYPSEYTQNKTHAQWVSDIHEYDKELVRIASIRNRPERLALLKNLNKKYPDIDRGFTLSELQRSAPKP